MVEKIALVALFLAIYFKALHAASVFRQDHHNQWYLRVQTRVVMGRNKGTLPCMRGVKPIPHLIDCGGSYG